MGDFKFPKTTLKYPAAKLTGMASPLALGAGGPVEPTEAVDIAQFSRIGIYSVQPGVMDFAQFSRIVIVKAAAGVTSFAQFSRVVIYSEA